MVCHSGSGSAAGLSLDTLDGSLKGAARGPVAAAGAPERSELLLEAPGFDEGTLWRRVFEIAEARAGRELPRAVVPQIRLSSPKITRQLTTEWFARRVDERHQRCLAGTVRARAAADSS